MDPIRKPYGDRMMELFQSAPQGDRSANSRPSRHNFDLSHAWKNNGGSDPGSVISISNTSSNDTFHRLCKQFGIGHPARFPESLVEFFIKAGTNEGDVVLDPFGGSGTTAIVAHRLGRDFRYIEINPEYHEMAQKWYEVEFSSDAVYNKIWTASARICFQNANGPYYLLAFYMIFIKRGSLQLVYMKSLKQRLFLWPD